MRSEENGSQKELTPGAKAEPPDLEEAKLRFKATCEEVSPLNIVRRRPLASVGVAFLAGFGLNKLGASRVAPPAMATMAQIASLVAQFAPLIIQRARSSDG